jgi:hypothetical protein
MIHIFNDLGGISSKVVIQIMRDTRQGGFDSVKKTFFIFQDLIFVALKVITFDLT